MQECNGGAGNLNEHCDVHYNVGDYITEKDNSQFVYEILKIEINKCLAKGINYRVYKWFLLDGIQIAESKIIKLEEERESRYLYKVRKLEVKTRMRHLTGKILHIDGDMKYLNKCLDLYKELGVYSYGACVKEEDMKTKVRELYYEVLPDVIVITGHDLYNNMGMKEVDNYTNTKYYVEAIKAIRRIDKTVIIIAGACQSNFEALIASGADFASSPGRINIHTFDPAVIAVKAATTAITKIIDLNETFKYIENGKKAFGGLETYGKLRIVL